MGRGATQRGRLGVAIGRGRWGGGQWEGGDGEVAKARGRRRLKRRADFTDGYNGMAGGHRL